MEYQPGIQVAQTEAEQVRSIFERIADSLVAASGLRGEIESLRHMVEGFQKDVESLRQQNQDLDRMVTEVRRQRDEAANELIDLKARTQDGQRTIDMLQRDNQSLNDVVERQRTQIETLKRERDNEAFSHLELREQLDKLQPLIESLANVLPKKQEAPVQERPYNPEYAPEPAKDPWLTKQDGPTYDPVQQKWSDEATYVKPEKAPF